MQRPSGTPGSTGEKSVRTWDVGWQLRENLSVLATSLEYRHQAHVNLGVLPTCLHAPMTSLSAVRWSLDVPKTCLGVRAMSQGASRITVEQSGKTSSLETLKVDLEIIATTCCSTIFKTHVLSLYSHLCVYIATHLHMEYLDWLQRAFESNLRCAWTWRLRELKHTLWGHDPASWRCTWRLWLTNIGDALGGNDHGSFESVI